MQMPNAPGLALAAASGIFGSVIGMSLLYTGYHLVGVSRGAPVDAMRPMVVLLVGLLITPVIPTTPQIIGGYKLWKERPNARTWGIIGSIVSCLSFPLGTAAGVYGLWFLFGDIGKQYYLGGSPQNAFNVPPQPPPPSSWQ
jgi:hypothetical protein